MTEADFVHISSSRLLSGLAPLPDICVNYVHPGKFVLQSSDAPFLNLCSFSTSLCLPSGSFTFLTLSPLVLDFPRADFKSFFGGILKYS